MRLAEYIAKHYGGNQAAFARSVDKPRQRVKEWVNAGNWYVYEGYLCQRKIKLCDIEMAEQNTKK
ncbi:hypothetical protein [Raoultella planticola]|uniref:DNA-binding protein n=1 Tax=Raoultella planticola TaxID=575 RepID=A0A485A5C9_RAOPL|nr:hypothetical protein [Raoultella planticola]KFD04274.1 hypothetical protein GRPL_04296 [Raoultella planticola ATCC 33531]VFS56102.1 Uncharacterised protein [Raoultella planticola]